MWCQCSLYIQARTASDFHRSHRPRHDRHSIKITSIKAAPQRRQKKLRPAMPMFTVHIGTGPQQPRPLRNNDNSTCIGQANLKPPKPISTTGCLDLRCQCPLHIQAQNQGRHDKCERSGDNRHWKNRSAAHCRSNHHFQQQNDRHWKSKSADHCRSSDITSHESC